jgi:hypothetical protein
METPTPHELTLRYVRSHPKTSAIEAMNGLNLPFNDVCEALDTLLADGSIKITAMRSSLDLYEVAEA